MIIKNNLFVVSVSFLPVNHASRHIFKQEQRIEYINKVSNRKVTLQHSTLFMWASVGDMSSAVFESYDTLPAPLCHIGRRLLRNWLMILHICVWCVSDICPIHKTNKYHIIGIILPFIIFNHQIECAFFKHIRHPPSAIWCREYGANDV